MLQEGDVVEQGSHQELYSNEGSVYHSLVRLQEQATEKREVIDAQVRSARMHPRLRSTACMLLCQLRRSHIASLPLANSDQA
jgi:ureidoglycolate hydrolase